MKSYVSYLQGLYAAILVDVAIEYPELGYGLRRDSSRLRSLIENRGLTVPLVDLPAFAKALERGLEEGRLGPTCIPGMGCRKGEAIPRLFKGILLLIFDKTGTLRNDFPPRALLHMRMLLLVAKRLKLPCPEVKTREEIIEFFKVDSQVRLGSLAWSDDAEGWGDYSFDEGRSDHLPSPDGQGDLLDLLEPTSEALAYWRSGISRHLDGVASILSSTLGHFDPASWSFRHGPGAVSDQSGQVDKYHFPCWPEQLEPVFPSSEFAFANYRAWADAVSIERTPRGTSWYSRLIAVPKTYSKPRLIASEPTAMQWCQQSIRDYLMERTKSTWIGRFVNFRRQDLSQDLALEASCSRELATIDLSSASDRISTWLVERTFKDKSLLDALRASRTRHVFTDMLGFPKLEKLRKFSCMGSACTFPIQTLVFLTIALSVCLYVDKQSVTLANLRKYEGKVRIFGDDIIVPQRSVRTLIAVLVHLGLKVNTSKSFWKGHFREACGMDAYKGVRVNPVYVLDRAEKSRPESVVSAVASHNNLFDRGYMCAANYIASTIHNEVSKLRYVEADSGAFGLKSLYPKNSLRTRVSSKLQVKEYFALRLTTKQKSYHTEGDAALLQYFTERPRPDLNWAAEQVPQTRLILEHGWVRAD